ncbi:MAG: putative metal-binding motif-containing protein [Pseudomonadota bacterium]|nr:putative metal-binding motif-containing protein [Pseudomonadota bacterium]
MLTLFAACNGPDEVDPGKIGPDLDRDDDGIVAASDCDDADPSVFPGAAEVPEDGIDQDCDGWDPLAEGTARGGTADEGYGTRVLITPSGVVVGAPFFGDPGATADGRVYGGLPGGGAAVSLLGEDGARAGAALALLADGTLLVGVPGTGGVRTLAHGALPGEPVLSLEGAGGVLAARGASWVTSTATGAALDDGTRLDWDRRPDALALGADGAVWAGFARGDSALRTGDGAVARATPSDEAGFTLLLADVGADGTEELVVGAPGAGVVYLLDPTALPASLADATPVGPGTGRFGAALAVDAAGVLYVGAPMAGATVAGAVYAVVDGVPSVRWEGTDPGDQLGFSLAAGRASLVMGAPGAADSPGSVQIVVP